MKKIAVILSGCGVFDGSEIHEAVLTLLAINKLGASYECFAPDIDVKNPINFYTNEPISSPRNVIEMSGRIARGKILSISQLNVSDFDGIMFPGGMGVVKNLCDFADKGVDCSVNIEIKQLILNAYNMGKVIGAICIAPVLIVKALGKGKVTIGNDASTASAIEEMGGAHIVCGSYDTCVDSENKIVTSPAYMLANSIVEIEQSAFNTVKNMLEIM